MATKKQKEELIQILKFTPIKVQILIQGYGGETYAGVVDRKIYDYFKSRKIDLEQYASDWDNEMKVPDEFQPFPAGSAYECDNLWHASGAELSDLNEITVYEVDSGKELWSHNLGYSDLEDAGVTIESSGGGDLDDLEDGTIVFNGGQGEKGCFFDAELTLRAPFDPKKLKIYYEDCGGWDIVTWLEYDGEELDGSGGYSTTGKWCENKWIIIGDEEEVYDSEEFDPEAEDWDPAEELDKIVPPEGLDWSPIKDEPAVTEWFDKDVKPAYKGTYEAVIDAPWPLSGVRMVEWTGRSWKEDGKKVLITKWRGLAENPNEV